ESVLALGAAFSGLHWRATVVTALVVGFAGTASLWWIYFVRHAEETTASSSAPPRRSSSLRLLRPRERPAVHNRRHDMFRRRPQRGRGRPRGWPGPSRRRRPILVRARRPRSRTCPDRRRPSGSRAARRGASPLRRARSSRASLWQRRPPRAPRPATRRRRRR